jgi:hypothetical protein
MRAIYHALMRFIYVLPLLLSINAWALPHDCTEADLATPSDIIGDCLTLKINNPVTVSASSGLNRIWITGITGDVEVNANITINGSDGGSAVNAPAGGNGLGGPGASDGGGNGFSGPEDGGTNLPPDGKTPSLIQSPCSSGGGGGGFLTVGASGLNCVSSTPPSNGGSANTSEFDFTFANFRGGFGGGSGAYGDDARVGAGGGGGGAFHIETFGAIRIARGVTISARGGNGGQELTNGGGGGAGSGGVIWLVSTAGISNKGTLDVRGGAGGKNTVTGAHGGDGSSGLFRLESAGVVTNGSGLKTFTDKSLKSDISCGTVSKKEETLPLNLQMMSGFLVALFIGALLKILFRTQTIV